MSCLRGVATAATVTAMIANYAATAFLSRIYHIVISVTWCVVLINLVFPLPHLLLVLNYYYYHQCNIIEESYA
jgi:hypothetical protein